MNKRWQELTAEMSKRNGAPDEVLRSLAASAWVEIPPDYMEFLKESNGAEGCVGNSYLELWPAEAVIRLNEEYHVREFLPGLMLFGSSLGGVAYGFDGRGSDVAVVEVPFDAMSLDSVIRRGDNLHDLLQFLFVQWPE